MTDLLYRSVCGESRPTFANRSGAQFRQCRVWLNCRIMMASRFRRRLVTVLLIGYAIFVMIITLTHRSPGSGFVTLLVYKFLEKLQERGITFITYMGIEFFGNILMFIPLGVFAALLIPRKAWWTLLFMGTAFSAFIELFQATFLPERYPEVRDLMSNTTGFLIGAFFAVMLRLLVSHRDRLVEQDRRAALAKAAR